MMSLIIKIKKTVSKYIFIYLDLTFNQNILAHKEVILSYILSIIKDNFERLNLHLNREQNNEYLLIKI